MLLVTSDCQLAPPILPTTIRYDTIEEFNVTDIVRVTIFGTILYCHTMIFNFVTDTVGLFSTDKVYHGSNVYSAVFHRRIALEKPNSSRVTAKNKPFQRILCDVSSTIRNRFNTTS